MRRLARIRMAGSLSGALALAAQGCLCLPAPPARATEVEIHYAPAENLERVDVDLFRSARGRIDLAAYALTDWPVIAALIDAGRRGVAIRIVLDPGQRHAFDRLREIAGSIRLAPAGPYMHLKSYAVDGHTLRSGSANLSASGLKQQDNDLLILRDAGLVDVFEGRFGRLWARSTPLPRAGAWLPAPALSKGAPTPSPRSCAIKGNVNAKGERIYHLPGGRDYDRVTMKGAGKRWFCTQAQAAMAGWRPASLK